MPPEENAATQKVDRLVADATQRLIAELKAGRSESLKAYLEAMGRFYQYSWTNSLLIHAQRPTATHVAGYHAWKELDRSVRRGEKGIVIVAPIIKKVPDPERPTRSGDAPEHFVRTVTGYRPTYVFDIAQTDGKPLPAFATPDGDPNGHTEHLKRFVERLNIAVHYDASIAPRDGVSLGGQIRLRPGLSPAEEFSVLTHELAHEMLHRSDDARQLSKTVRETQAEAVAYVVCRGIGLETRTAAADYIALYRGDADTLRASLSAIQLTSSMILDALVTPDRRAPDRTAPFFEHQQRNENVLPESADLRTSAIPPPDPLDSMSLDH